MNKRLLVGEQRTARQRAADRHRTGCPPTHGMHGSPAWRSWFCMMNRVKGFSRGRHAATYSKVTVCIPWLRFEAFFDDMGTRPAGCTLDRLDNTRGYSPDNCRWATPSTQNQNRRFKGGRKKALDKEAKGKMMLDRMTTEVHGDRARKQ